ncbi:Phosphoprotein phosphatase [Balamuthia mandrillaris]
MSKAKKDSKVFTEAYHQKSRLEEMEDQLEFEGAEPLSHKKSRSSAAASASPSICTSPASERTTFEVVISRTEAIHLKEGAFHVNTAREEEQEEEEGEELPQQRLQQEEAEEREIMKQKEKVEDCKSNNSQKRKGGAPPTRPLVLSREATLEARRLRKMEKKKRKKPAPPLQHQLHQHQQQEFQSNPSENETEVEAMEDDERTGTSSLIPSPLLSATKKRFDKLIVLDLDGTLIHSEFRPRPHQPHDFSLFDDEIFVFKRPYLKLFLDTLLEWFEVGVWTASGCEYAAKVVQNIFADPRRLKFIYSAERCTNKSCAVTGERVVIKDLRKLRRKGYLREKMLIIDDTPSTWTRNYGNAVPIEPYWGARVDDQLLLLLHYLEMELGPAENVRTLEKRNWKEVVLSSQRFQPQLTSNGGAAAISEEELEDAFQSIPLTPPTKRMNQPSKSITTF